ncbi:MAG TPA: hypothetical protein VHX88_06405 [Solirubrobacteraceae bacterium]|jgi:uncharacterized membrane protein YeaQ/YmgE (transglycosylase-associated protein family)|nr:hypothetical protein [Solirubrobacteraceae bacterium]
MLSFLIAVAIAGLIVGGVARLLLPGPDPIGFFGTIGVGLLGSFAAGLFSWSVLHLHHRAAGLLLSIIFSMIVLWLLRLTRAAGPGTY